MQKKIYFKKDKRACVYKHTVVSGDGVMPQDEYSLMCPEKWCYTSQLSQSRIFEAIGVGSNENRFFVFNPSQLRGEIEVDDAIKYRGKWYHITRVDTQDDYKGELFVYVDDMSEPPKPEQINSYWI